MARRSERHGGMTGAARWSVDLAMLVAIGLLMGFLGPFGSDRFPAGSRYLYWMICMVGGGLIGLAGDAVFGRFIPGLLKRATAVSLVMTPPVTVLVFATQHLLMGDRFDWGGFSRLWWQVLPLLLAVMLVHALAWRRGPERVETRTIVAPPLPEAEAAFRRRLSARRRTARLIAVEAHDHYLKVHTDQGEELITLRFVDALEELELAHGWRVHRSWWVAASAVEGVRWRRGGGELRLAGGLKAPVSRTYATVLKSAGWF